MSVDVLLIQPLAQEGELFNLPGKEVPLNLLGIAAYLHSQGVSARVLDLTIEPDPEASLAAAMADPPLVAGLTAFTTNVALTHRLAERIKQLAPSVPTVLGGFHASALPEHTLQEFPAFDMVVQGEGEITMHELVVRIAEQGDLKEIPGLWLHDTQGNGALFGGPRDLIQDLDSLPLPDRKIVPHERYIPDPGNYYRLPSTGILYSRGCPMKCAYCSKSVFRDTVRYRSVENFLEEVRLCGRDLGVSDFRLYDEGPTIRKDKITALCEGIISSGLDITWNCFSRVDTINEEQLRLMARAGCYHVIYGIESGHRPTQERINKVLDLPKAIELCRLTRRIGIECKANFIIGFPWEDEDAIRETLALARRIDADLVTINLFKPFPGSRLYDDMSADGLIKEEAAWEDYFTTSSAEVFKGKVPPERLKRILKMAWLGYYFRPRMILRRIWRMIEHPGRELKMNLTGFRVLLANLFR